MTKAVPLLNLPYGSEFAEQAGVLARTSGELLNSAHGELSALLSQLEVRHPQRAKLGEIGHALESARELTRQLIVGLGLTALQGQLLGSEPEVKQRPAPEVARPAMVALVVESNDGLRRLMGEVIRRQGYRVLEARTAEEAEQVVAQSPFLVDKLVTEVLIAGTSGVALGSRLRLMQPQMTIVYTVCEAHEAVVPRGAMGQSTVLKKPFTVAGLSDALKGVEAE